MKQLRMWFLLITVMVIGTGFFRGWFVLSSTPGSAVDNKLDIHLTVDPDKVQDDASKIKQSVKDQAHDFSETKPDSVFRHAGSHFLHFSSLSGE